MALTRRQREVLDFITDFIRTRRYSPSLEEIAANFGLSSVATVHKHVSNLERKGFIKRDWNRSRSIDVTEPQPVAPVGYGKLLPMPPRVAEARFADGSEASGASGGRRPREVSVPGAVDALRGGYEPDGPLDQGRPEVVRLPLQGRVAAGQPIEAITDRETLAVPASMVGRGRCYVLEVKGDSMIGEHIQDGDYVIVEERQDPRNGEKVIALIGDGEATLKTFHRESGGTVRLDPANPAFQPIRVREGAFRVQGVVIGVMRKYRR